MISRIPDCAVACNGQFLDFGQGADRFAHGERHARPHFQDGESVPDQRGIGVVTLEIGGMGFEYQASGILLAPASQYFRLCGIVIDNRDVIELHARLDHQAHNARPGVPHTGVSKGLLVHRQGPCRCLRRCDGQACPWDAPPGAGTSVPTM